MFFSSSPSFEIVSKIALHESLCNYLSQKELSVSKVLYYVWQETQKSADVRSGYHCEYYYQFKRALNTTEHGTVVSLAYTCLDFSVLSH